MAGSVALAVVSFVAQSVVSGKAEKKRAQAAREASEERKKAGQISEAQAVSKERIARRQRIREERVRRAQIVQGAGEAGVGVSSGVIGAGSVLGTGTATAIAGSLGAAKARVGITSANQAAADATVRGQQAGASAALFAQGIGLFQTVGAKVISAGLFDPAPTLKTESYEQKIKRGGGF